MAKLNNKTADRLENTISSLVQLRREISGTNSRFDETHIDWIEIDIQSLKIVAEKMNLEFYAQEDSVM